MTDEMDDHPDATLRALFEQPELPAGAFERAVAARLTRARWERRLVLSGVAAAAAFASGAALMLLPAVPTRVDWLASSALVEALVLTGTCACVWVWAE